MAKQLQVTDEMKAQMRANAGDPNLDTSKLAVFHAEFMNTHPLSKSGSIFDKAVVTRGTLQQMADFVNKTGHVPLHTLHMQGAELPVGRVFHASIVDNEDGSASLRGHFYVPKDNANLVSDLDNSVVSEVSPGLKSTKLLCSECGFDYFGPDAKVSHLWDRTDPEGHVLGENGVHARLSGLDRWMELSLVSRGAGRKPNILSRVQASLGQETLERLAASGISPEATILYGASSPGKVELPSTKVIATMTDKAQDQLIEALVENRTMKLAADAFGTERTGLQASLKTATDELAALKAAQPKVAEMQAQLTLVTAFLADQSVAALTATGTKDAKAPLTIELQLEAIKAAGVKLHQLITAGGTTEAIDKKTETDEQKAARLAAFRTAA